MEEWLMPQSAIVIDQKDNVPTALRQFEPGESIRVEVGNGIVEIILWQTIPFGHKFALKDIEQREPIVKYGEVIGLAAMKIKRGEHTHVHNVEGLEGKGASDEVLGVP
jgi:altronate dehydratase small subunit